MKTSHISFTIAHIFRFTRLGLTNRKDRVILYPRHAQVLDHALNFRIANIGPVNMANQVQQGQHGDQTGVHLNG